MNHKDLKVSWGNTPSMEGLPIQYEVCWTEDLKRFFVVPVDARIGHGSARVWGGTKQWVLTDLAELQVFETTKKAAQRQGWTNNRIMVLFYLRSIIAWFKNRFLSFGSRFDRLRFDGARLCFFVGRKLDDVACCRFGTLSE